MPYSAHEHYESGLRGSSTTRPALLVEPFEGEWAVLRREGELDPATIDYRTTILRRCKTEQEAEKQARLLQNPLEVEEE